MKSVIMASLLPLLLLLLLLLLANDRLSVRRHDVFWCVIAYATNALNLLLYIVVISIISNSLPIFFCVAHLMMLYVEAIGCLKKKLLALDCK